VDTEILLSLANADIRVWSKNHRNANTACLKVLNTRVPLRVPRRTRSACNSPDSHNTLSSDTSRTASYVTLTTRGTPLEDDL
jgi:hypothetical protein